MSENKGNKYPMEISSVVRGQTLSVTSALSLATTAEGYRPLTIFNPFSRYVFAIINEARIAVTANVSFDEIANIREVSRIAQKMDIESRFAPAPMPVKTETKVPDSPAYSVKLSGGKFKGNTPAQILAADAGSAKDLNDLYVQLKKLAKAEPENAPVYTSEMEAIADAANRLKAGTLFPDTKGTESAYSVKIGNGKHKGKSPAEVLQEGGEQDLIRQRKWLEEHLAQYAGNQKQIDAIDAAFRLKEAGLLGVEESTEKASPDGRGVKIYEALYRPLTRKKNANGKCFVYEISVTWYLGQEYPVAVRIANYYAPVIENPKTKMLNVKASEAEERINSEMLLSAAEWNSILDAIGYNMQQFAVLHAKDCYKDAEETDRKNREKSGEGGGGHA